MNQTGSTQSTEGQGHSQSSIFLITDIETDHSHNADDQTFNSDLGKEVFGKDRLVHRSWFIVHNLRIMRFQSQGDSRKTVCEKEEISLTDPEIIKQGSKYGVKIHSEAPSIHMIRANIETEIAPIVGNEQQAQDILRYIKDAKEQEGGVWETNIFGKTIEELVMDGMRHKITMINDECQGKLQDTMQKIVNDSNGGIVCIII